MAEYQITVSLDSETMGSLWGVLQEVGILIDSGQWEGFSEDYWPARAFVTQVRTRFIDAVGGDGFERDARGVYRVTNPTVGRDRPMLRTLV
ncbi:MAG: hypothetical protein ACO3O3_12325 [Ilumatobacteraceae bacterium]